MYGECRSCSSNKYVYSEVCCMYVVGSSVYLLFNVTSSLINQAVVKTYLLMTYCNISCEIRAVKTVKSVITTTDQHCFVREINLGNRTWRQDSLREQRVLSLFFDRVTVFLERNLWVKLLLKALGGLGIVLLSSESPASPAKTQLNLVRTRRRFFCALSCTDLTFFNYFIRLNLLRQTLNFTAA